MAFYDYYCEKCGEKFEIKASVNDDRKWVKCPKCKGNKVSRLFDGVNISKSKTGADLSSCPTCSTGTCGI